VDGIAAVALVRGGADLHAPEARAGVEDEVVAITVSPGLGDGEAQVDGFVHESKFGQLSATLGRAGVALIGRRTARFRVNGFVFHRILLVI
jgi:hypothetical protein